MALPARIRVGVVGPGDSVEDVVSLAPEFPSLCLEPVRYEDERQASSVFAAARERLDVALFTGPIPYYRVLQEVGTTLPMTFVPFTGAALYRALFLLRDFNPLHAISVDTVERAAVYETFGELGLHRVTAHVLEYHQVVDRDEFIDFHHRLYADGRAQVALTCLRTAYLALQRQGVPTVRVIPPRAVLRETLDKVSLLGSQVEANGRQLIVGLLRVLPKERRREWRVPPKVVAEVRQFVHEIAGLLTAGKDGDFLFLTTWALFNQASGALHRAPLLDRLGKAHGLTYAMGVGRGATAHQALLHARSALQRALAYDTACFVMLDSKHLVGPLGTAETIRFAMRTTDPGLLATAAGIGVSVAQLERVLAAVARTGAQFTAEEVAPFLRVSPRSARRLLRRLEGGGLVRVVGQERIHLRGRPRSLFQVRLPQVQEASGRERWANS